jgi:O-antigen/teichoic acid export membrane protein
MGLGVVALSSAFLAESLTLFVVAWLLFLGHPFRRPSRALLASYAVYAAPLVVTMILGSIIANLDRVMLRQFWNEEEVGYYVGILGIIAVLGRVSSAAMKLFFPRVSYDAARGDLGAIRKRLAAAERYLFMVMVPAVVGVIAFRYLLIRTLLGPRFMPAAGALAVLALEGLLMTYFRPYGNLVYAIEQQPKLIISGILQLVVLVIANVLLVPRQLFGVPLAGLGNLGTAIAFAAMEMTGGIFEVAICAHYAGIGPYGRVARFVPAGLAMYLVLWLAERLSGPLGMWQALAFGPLSVAVFVGVSALVGEFTRADATLFFDLVDPRKMVGYVTTELRSKSEAA